MKFVSALLVASFAASASAFAPAVPKQATVTSSTTLLQATAFDDALGAQPPLGFFDPLGLVADGDQAKFERLRYVELKHGRVCMLGFLGQITTRYGIHFDAPLDKEAGTRFEDYPNGLAALFGPKAIPSDRFWEIVFFVGWLELFVMKDVEGTGNEFPGDFRNGYDFGWDKFTPEAKLYKRQIELNQGRAAMMGLLGLMVHEKLNEIGVVADLPIIGVLE